MYIAKANRIKNLVKLLKKQNLNGYILNSSDEFLSEYTPNLLHSLLALTVVWLY